MENHDNTLKTQPEKFFGNIAKPTGEALIDPCVNCNETILFAMRDNERTFAIGLTTILRCLHFADEQGEVPKLSEEWWIAVKKKYRFE